MQDKDGIDLVREFSVLPGNENIMVICCTMLIIFCLLPPGQSNPEAKLLSQMEEVNTCTLHYKVSATIISLTLSDSI